MVPDTIFLELAVHASHPSAEVLRGLQERQRGLAAIGQSMSLFELASASGAISPIEAQWFTAQAQQALAAAQARAHAQPQAPVSPAEPGQPVPHAAGSPAAPHPDNPTPPQVTPAAAVSPVPTVAAAPPLGATPATAPLSAAPPPTAEPNEPPKAPQRASTQGARRRRDSGRLQRRRSSGAVPVRRTRTGRVPHRQAGPDPALVAGAVVGGVVLLGVLLMALGGRSKPAPVEVAVSPSPSASAPQRRARETGARAEPSRTPPPTEPFDVPEGFHGRFEVGQRFVFQVRAETADGQVFRGTRTNEFVAEHVRGGTTYLLQESTYEGLPESFSNSKSYHRQGARGNVLLDLADGREHVVFPANIRPGQTWRVRRDASNVRERLKAERLTSIRVDGRHLTRVLEVSYAADYGDGITAKGYRYYAPGLGIVRMSTEIAPEGSRLLVERDFDPPRHLRAQPEPEPSTPAGEPEPGPGRVDPPPLKPEPEPSPEPTPRPDPVASPTPAPAAAALSAKELASYLDLRAGASWTFTLKATGQAVSRTTNTKVTKLGGVEWTVQVSENLLAKGAPQTAHVRAATTGIVRRESNGQEVLLVPAPLRRGQTWPAPGAQGTCTFSGFEDVTVGGQRYARCLRVEVRQAQATTVTWYAPGKGSVAFETVMNARTVAALHVTRYVPGKGRAPAIKSGPAVVGKPQPAGSPSPAGDPALKVQGSGEGSLEEANAGWFRYTSARAEDTRSSFPRSRARARARRRPGSGACGP